MTWVCRDGDQPTVRGDYFLVESENAFKIRKSLFGTRGKCCQHPNACCQIWKKTSTSRFRKLQSVSYCKVPPAPPSYLCVCKDLIYSVGWLYIYRKVIKSLQNVINVMTLLNCNSNIRYLISNKVPGHLLPHTEATSSRHSCPKRRSEPAGCSRRSEWCREEHIIVGNAVICGAEEPPRKLHWRGGTQAAQNHRNM